MTTEEQKRFEEILDNIYKKISGLSFDEAYSLAQQTFEDLKKSEKAKMNTASKKSSDSKILTKSEYDAAVKEIRKFVDSEYQGNDADYCTFYGPTDYNKVLKNKIFGYIVYFSNFDLRNTTNQNKELFKNMRKNKIKVVTKDPIELANVLYFKLDVPKTR